MAPRLPDGARPTRAQVAAAFGRTVPDLIGPGLKVLFCGINPSLYSAATRHHFARPGNRFWPALHRAGFTSRLLKPQEEQLLLAEGIGITNLVVRATAAASELGDSELRAGRSRLERKVERYGPEWVAIVGIGAYRTAFERSRALAGRQSDRLASSGIWVLPNPSGLNANHQIEELADAFRCLREVAFS